MPAAIILLNVDAKETKRIGAAIAEIPGVAEVYSVAGNYDLVVVVRTPTNESLADLVTDRIRIIPGIAASQTLIAFRQYSPRDITAMFDMN